MCLLSVLVHSALYQCLRICRLTFCPIIPSCAPCGLSSSVSTQTCVYFLQTLCVPSSLTFVRLFFICLELFLSSYVTMHGPILHCSTIVYHFSVCVCECVSLNSSSIWGWEMWVKWWSVGFWCMSGSARLLPWPPAATSASPSLLQNVSAALLSSLAIGFLL